MQVLVGGAVAVRRHHDQICSRWCGITDGATTGHTGGGGWHHAILGAALGAELPKALRSSDTT